MKSVRIRNSSGPYFPAFGLYTTIWPVSLRIHSKCGSIRTWKSPNADTFHEMYIMLFYPLVLPVLLTEYVSLFSNKR